MDKLGARTPDATTAVVDFTEIDMRDAAANGPEDLLDWEAIDWRDQEAQVQRLRQRIFKARQVGDHKQVRNLQKLMLRSRANTLVACAGSASTTLAVTPQAWTGPDRDVPRQGTDPSLAESWRGRSGPVLSDYRGNPSRRSDFPAAPEHRVARNGRSRRGRIRLPWLRETWMPDGHHLCRRFRGS